MTDSTTTLDPFTTIYRICKGYNSRTGEARRRVYHLNPNCPALGGKSLKGRLGAALAAGRVLCRYEGGPGTRNDIFGGRDQ